MIETRFMLAGDTLVEMDIPEEGTAQRAIFDDRVARGDLSYYDGEMIKVETRGRVRWVPAYDSKGAPKDVTAKRVKAKVKVAVEPAADVSTAAGRRRIRGAE